jgi:hypothetical protein
MGTFQDTVALQRGVNAATKRTQQVIETKGTRFLMCGFIVKRLLLGTSIQSLGLEAQKQRR